MSAMDKTKLNQFTKVLNVVMTERSLNITKGGLQGSVSGPTLFIIYIHNTGQHVTDASVYIFSDDTVVYCYAVSLVFDCIQHYSLGLFFYQ